MAYIILQTNSVFHRLLIQVSIQGGSQIVYRVLLEMLFFLIYIQLEILGNDNVLAYKSREHLIRLSCRDSLVGNLFAC